MFDLVCTQKPPDILRSIDIKELLKEFLLVGIELVETETAEIEILSHGKTTGPHRPCRWLKEELAIAIDFISLLGIY